MNKIFLTLVILGSFFVTEAQNKSEELDKLMTQAHANGVFKGSVLVAENGKVIYRKAFGYANKETKQLLKPEFCFDLASVSKQFTAMGIMILKERYKLSYDDKITKYFSEFPAYGKDITIRNLLNNTSGMPLYQPFANKDNLTNAEILKIIEERETLDANIGERYFYNNAGYVMLALIIEKVSNMSLAEFLKENIFKPLKMNNTFPEINGNDSSNISLFYHKSKEGKIYIAKEVNNFYKFASGGFLSTTEDLVKFGNSYLNNDLLNKKTIEDFTHFQIIGGLRYNYGLGWQLLNDESNVLKSFYHVGKGVGGYGLLIVYPKEKIVISLLANVGELDLEKEVFSMSKIFLNL